MALRALSLGRVGNNINQIAHALTVRRNPPSCANPFRAYLQLRDAIFAAPEHGPGRP